MGLFIVAASFLTILNIAVILSPVRYVGATTAENVTGWAWSATGGWLSMNDMNVGAGGGSYGVHIDAVTSNVNGFAWSSNAGWICFGDSCNVHAECAGDPPGAMTTSSAYMDTDGELHGWARFCNLKGEEGWISLNCDNLDLCAASDYGVQVNLVPTSPTFGEFSGWAWNGLASAVGWGWIDFSGVRLSLIEEGPVQCSNAPIDDDLDGLVDCCDPTNCQFNVAYGCPSNEMTEGGLVTPITPLCDNGIDEDCDGLTDCEDPDCATYAKCIPEDEHGPGSCGDGIDNDLDGPVDCDDPDCAGAPGCEICDNGIDDDGDGLIDCEDPDCETAPECTPAWLQSKYGNVYAKLGVEGNPPPPGQANATYCITSAGEIVQATSTSGCIEQYEDPDISLPTGQEGYVSNLGRIDVAGILNGRYGPVVHIGSASQINSPLNGTVYMYDGPGPLTIGPKTFLNASGSSGQGNGLLVIKGEDLYIDGDLDYESSLASDYIRNIASLGILVLAKYVGGTYDGGGNIYIDPSVQKFVGAIYAERSIHTGSTGNRFTDVPLEVYGVLVSREVALERRWSSPGEAAETVTFDGRAVVNPPPGYQDISKSLPLITEPF